MIKESERLLKKLFTEFSEEGFIFVDKEQISGFMDSSHTSFKFVSNSFIRTVTVDNYQLHSHNPVRTSDLKIRTVIKQQPF